MNTDQPTVAALAETAAEVIRAANHRTIVPGDLPVPEVYRVLGELSALAHRLPQLCDQLARNLRHRQSSGDLRLDSHGQRTQSTTDHLIEEAEAALAGAADLLAQIGRLLDQAQAAIAFVADHGDDA